MVLPYWCLGTVYENDGIILIIQIDGEQEVQGGGLSFLFPPLHLSTRLQEPSNSIHAAGPLWNSSSGGDIGVNNLHLYQWNNMN